MVTELESDVKLTELVLVVDRVRLRNWILYNSNCVGNVRISTGNLIQVSWKVVKLCVQRLYVNMLSAVLYLGL